MGGLCAKPNRDDAPTIDEEQLDQAEEDLGETNQSGLVKEQSVITKKIKGQLIKQMSTSKAKPATKRDKPKKPMIKHVVPHDFSHENVDVFWTQKSPTIKVTIRGDPAKYVLDKITRKTKPADILKRVAEEFDTHYGAALKEVKEDQFEIRVIDRTYKCIDG